MVNVIICDDNNKDRNNIENITKNFMEKRKLEYNVHSFDDYNKKFYSILESKLPFKIYLLDIETPSRSGIDVAREIRRKDVDSVIIFLTAHEELGNLILRKDLMFLSFINKFDNYENRLNKSLEKALGLLKTKNTIRFNDRNVLYTINVDDILYITKDETLDYPIKIMDKYSIDYLKINKNKLTIFERRKIKRIIGSKDFENVIVIYEKIVLKEKL